MPLLCVSKFNEGMVELVESSFAILVLVLPPSGDRAWTTDEVDVVEVVAEQVVITLSHAAILEESLQMREKLMEQNMALDRARHEALMAKEAQKSLQSVLTRELVGLNRLVVAALSALQLEKLNIEQLAMVKAGLVLPSVIEEVTDGSRFEEARVELRFRPFDILSMIQEAVSMSRLLCACRGVSFEFHVSGGIPGPVLGDDEIALLRREGNREDEAEFDSCNGELGSKDQRVDEDGDEVEGVAAGVEGDIRCGGDQRSRWENQRSRRWGGNILDLG